jgi:predicted nucleic acid-binding protein
MILVDTSVWIDHLRRGDDTLAELLEGTEVWCHLFVRGELACGHLQNRREILSLMESLPESPVAGHEEVMTMVESRRLMGRGLGWVDVHLLASAMLAGIPLWTRDRRLASVAEELGLAPL